VVCAWHNTFVFLRKPAQATLSILRSLFIPLTFVFLWSTGFVGAKYGLPYAEPFTFLLVRMIIAAALLAVIILFTTQRWPTRKDQILHSMVVGVLIHGLYLGGVFFAISRGMGAGMSALIVGLQPLVTLLLASRFLDETINRRKVLGIALGIFGVALVVISQNPQTSMLVPIGILACVVALFGISVGTVYQKRYCADIDLLPSVCLQYIGNAMLLFVLTVSFETMSIQWTGEFIFAMAWLVVVLSLGAVLLLMWLIQRGDSGEVASLFYLVPPFTAIEAWLLFGESMSVPALVGFAMCVAGVALVVRSKHR